MPKNIVICCDGTGNEIGSNISNVLKLFRIAEKDDEQHVYYNPGIGTIAKLATWGRLRQKLSEVFGLATGYGLNDNIVDAYSYLCGTYAEGDRIFLFGFSRGAYTVRAVAGRIDLIGLLRPDQFNIDDYALTAYKRAAEQHELKIAWQFGRIAGGRDDDPLPRRVGHRRFRNRAAPRSHVHSQPRIPAVHVIWKARAASQSFRLSG